MGPMTPLRAAIYPPIRIGRLLRVPVRALERMLDRASGGVTPTPHQPIEPEPGQK
jgi:hypothetical protein